MDTSPEGNMARLRDAYHALQGGDLDACVEMLSPDFIANIPGLPGPVYGTEIWRQGARAMLAGFPDLRIDVEDMFGAADRVAVRARFHGTHLGAFQGARPTGERVAFWSLEMYRFEGGRIAEEWVAPDMAGLMRQISGTGSPA
ncbi:ester cyclase [Marinactinospora rubrisoli]|uniref:Ester cyclase n=1 Tax=Marinactinospora rubrisoli TaxID=2715399 RepID=A0ABW2KI50_9ACTN